VLWRLIKASAVVACVGLAAAGCAVQPLKMGAAAIVGSDRISIATLGIETTSLSQAAKQYPGVVTLTPTEETQATLTWLIRYKIQEELARQNGIYVSPEDAEKWWNLVYSNAASSAQAQGLTNVTPTLIMAASGIPPSTLNELKRYEAISGLYVMMVSGGKTPTTSSAQTAADDKLSKAECQAAKSLNIQVNPQFGQLDYTELAVVSAPSSVTRAPGPTTAASPVATAPAC
jgi:hypothetical protein